MTVLAPEFLQTTKYSAQRMRQMMVMSGPLQEGIVNFGDFKVAQRGAGANMSVDVAAGDAWVQGDNTARQGSYHVGNDGVVNVAVPAANATNPRIDQVVLRVYDSTVIGGEKDLAVIEVVSGTATVGATLANLTGAAALPASAIRLAYILVGAAVTKVETANLGNLRTPRAGLTGYPAAASPLALAGAPPQYAMGRPAGYVPLCVAQRATNQSIPNAGDTPINFNNADTVDLEAIHDTVTNNTRLTIQTPGMYDITAHYEFSEGFAAYQGFYVRLNGATQTFRAADGNGQRSSETLTGKLYLAYGDYLEAICVHNSGTAKNVQADMSIAWMAP